LVFLDTDLKEIKSLDKDFEIFGSSSHRYNFNPPLEEKRIREFEDYYEIELPKEYRAFIKKIGNGGAGPYYGISNLKKSIAEYYQQDKNYLKDDFPHIEDWNWSNKLFDIIHIFQRDEARELNDYYHKKYLMTSEWEVDKEEWEVIKLFSGKMDSEIGEFFDEAYWKLYYAREVDQGSIDICEYGCNLRFKLIISGKERGRIWFDARVDQAGMYPVKNKLNHKIGFFEWYIKWLDESIEEILKKNSN